jgi:hypothetical protein
MSLEFGFTRQIGKEAAPTSTLNSLLRQGAIVARNLIIARDAWSIKSHAHKV